MRRSSVETSVATAEKISAALAFVYQAWKYARQLDRDLWDFAVEIRVLEGRGLSPKDCHGLVTKGYARQAPVEAGADDDGDALDRRDRIALPQLCCFMLSEVGTQRALSTLGRGAASVERVLPADGLWPIASAPVCRAQWPVPCWDFKLRELQVAGRLVKRFRVPSPNQETILAAFQEEGWPELIDDPLPPKSGKDSKRRVHDTIKNLNRHQATRLLRFCGDGTGKRIRWDFRDRVAPRLSQ